MKARGTKNDPIELEPGLWMHIEPIHRPGEYARIVMTADTRLVSEERLRAMVLETAREAGIPDDQVRMLSSTPSTAQGGDEETRDG
jgi:hypothetical protein